MLNVTKGGKVIQLITIAAANMAEATTKLLLSVEKNGQTVFASMNENGGGRAGADESLKIKSATTVEVGLWPIDTMNLSVESYDLKIYEVFDDDSKVLLHTDTLTVTGTAPLRITEEESAPQTAVVRSGSFGVTEENISDVDGNYDAVKTPAGLFLRSNDQYAMIGGGHPQVLNCFPGMNLKTIIDAITDASALKRYVINIYPGALFDVPGITFKQYIHYKFVSPVKFSFSASSVPYYFSMADFRGNVFEDNSVWDTDNGLGGSLFVGEADFSYCQLRGLTLTLGAAADFTNTKFRYANLEGASFDLAAIGVTFSGTDFTGANLRDAKFGGDMETVLMGANFKGANLTRLNNGEFLDKATFKTVVDGNWDPITTIWIDGLPIGA